MAVFFGASVALGCTGPVERLGQAIRVRALLLCGYGQTECVALSRPKAERLRLFSGLEPAAQREVLEGLFEKRKNVELVEGWRRFFGEERTRWAADVFAEEALRLMGELLEADGVSAAASARAVELFTASFMPSSPVVSEFFVVRTTAMAQLSTLVASGKLETAAALDAADALLEVLWGTSRTRREDRNAARAAMGVRWPRPALDTIAARLEAIPMWLDAEESAAYERLRDALSRQR